MALSGNKSYTLTIGTGPLAITIGVIRSASGLDASSYAEALPTLSLSPKTSKARQSLSDLQPLEVLLLLKSITS